MSGISTSFFAPTKSQAEVDYMFTCLVAEAIRHVNKFKLTHERFSRAEIVGEFCNALRRYSREGFFYSWNLGNTQYWQEVAFPEPNYWSFLKTQGYKMPVSHADNLCVQAQRMAAGDKTIEEEFREINSSLNGLVADKTGLDVLVQKAKTLNMEANTVLEHLCSIAQNIGEFTPTNSKKKSTRKR